MYWIGQKVQSSFSVRYYGKTQMNFLANPIIVVNDMAKNSGNLSTDTHRRTAILKVPSWKFHPPSWKFLSGIEAFDANNPVLIATSTVNTSWGRITEVDGDIGKTSAGPGKGNVNTSVLPFWLLTLQQKLPTSHTILCHSTL